MREDSLAASQWVNTLPDSEARDRATQAIVDDLRTTSPSDAFAWAESISDPETRFTNIQRVYQDWSTLDPSAARAAIANAPLTQEQKAQLIQP